MIFVDEIDVALPRSIADAAGIDAAVVRYGLARSARHTQQSQLAGHLNLVVGDVAHLGQGLAHQTDAVTRRCPVAQPHLPREAWVSTLNLL